MCGIAGFVGHRLLDDGAWRAMHAAIGPRGPDARGAVLWNADFTRTEAAPAAALLHTRLSIRDLRTVADQPMSNADGRVWICYNGEVYGWEHERASLEARGHTFRTTGDTEFILNAYLEWGLSGMLERLRGMFAFALLDLRIGKLYLVRDRMGIKPLVYYHGDGELAFGSTLRSVLPYLPAAARALDADAIDAYLAHRYVPAPRTVLTGCRRLPHAHYACFDLASGELTLSRYWQPQPAPGRALADGVEEAVQLRTVSDRPIGLFLSGGVDSATVASILRRSGHEDISAYTAAFPGTSYDEAPLAARIAQALGLRHVVLPIALDVGADFERLVADLDEPFADPSSIPLWYLARAAVQHVRVVMGGDGGDELFAGYKRYAKHLGSRWRRHWYLRCIRTRGGHLPGRIQKLLDELAMTWVEAYSLRFSGMNLALRRFLQPGRRSLPATWWDNMPRHAGDALATLLAIDMDNYLPEYILRKGDLCTMAHGLELRVPLLDHRLYEAVLALPAAARFTRPRKLALAQVCPVCTELQLFAQRKRGFNPPLAPLLRGALRVRLDGLGVRLQGRTAGQLDAARVTVLVDAFLAGADARAEQVLQLLVLDESLRQLSAHGTHRVH